MSGDRPDAPLCIRAFSTGLTVPALVMQVKQQMQSLLDEHHEGESEEDDRNAE